MKKKVIISLLFLGLTQFLLPGGAFAQNVIAYPPVALPTPASDPALSQPMGVGPVAAGGPTVSLHVDTGAFSSPMDVYLGIMAPAIDPNALFLFAPDGTIVAASQQVAAWRTGSLLVDEQVFVDFPATLLPPGNYDLMLFAAPTGTLTNYTLWHTSFRAPGTSGVTVGQIARFGSVVVNGVAFETPLNVVVKNETLSISMGELRKGMVVRVEGVFYDDGVTGKANLIQFKDNLEGPITDLVETTPGLVKSLTVLGQTVLVENGTTQFDDDDPAFNFDTMTVGDVVEVSGFQNQNGTISATYLHRKAADMASFLTGDDLEIEGTVEGLTAETFTIGNLTVSYAGVTPREGTLQNGVRVEVKGNAFDSASNTFTATDIEIETQGLSGGSLDRAEVEGIVMGMDSTAQTFIVNGQTVDFSGARFTGGPAVDLANGMKVEVEGPVVDGMMMAREIYFEDGISIEGNVASVDPIAHTLSLELLPGITALLDNAVTGNALDGLSAGNHVKIRGRLAETSSGGNLLMVNHLELLDLSPANSLSIQGPVDAFDATLGTITILGFTIDTSVISDSEFKSNDTVLGRQAFFEALVAGNVVQASGTTEGGTIVWQEIEFED